MPGSQRSEYCLKQASACASKATKTAVPDIKEAYSNLEQAWLQLAPDFEGDLSAPRAGTASDVADGQPIRREQK